MRLAAGLVALTPFIAGCGASTDVPQTVELNYSIYSVNGKSPAAQTTIGFTQDEITIPRGSLLMHKDGTVVEILQYVITRGSGEQIAATDTTYGHYEKVGTGYDIRLPNSFGSEAFSGSVDPDIDLFRLSRSWTKQNITVKLDIVYARY